MKLRTLLVSSLLVATTFTANALDFGDKLKKSLGKSEKESTEQVENTTQSSALVDYASEKLGLSKEITSGALGAVFKVAKDNLGENFASISDAIPDVESYIKNAPSESKSSLSGLASKLGKSSDEGQAAASLGYLDSAFKKLGIPKETVLPLVDTLTNYLENNNYGTAAAMLKKGVNFL